MPKEGTNCVCLLLILIDSVSRMTKTIIHKHSWKSVNKNVVKVNKMTNFLDKELEQDSSDNYSDESNTE